MRLTGLATTVWSEPTLAQALTEKRPLALLVATPAFCQISICGPVLDVLLLRSWLGKLARTHSPASVAKLNSSVSSSTMTGGIKNPDRTSTHVWGGPAADS